MLMMVMMMMIPMMMTMEGNKSLITYSFVLILGEVMISVLDPKREVGLWHSVMAVCTQL